MNEKSTYVVTNFIRKEYIRQDFFSGPHGVEESLKNVMRQFDVDRYIFVGTSDEDHTVAGKAGQECLPVEDAVEAVEWVLVGDDDAPAGPFEAEGRDD